MSNPTTATWTDPTTNVDGSPIVAGEITGYTLGIRAASGTPGTYPITGAVADPAASSELLTALSATLAPGVYFAAVQANGPVNSAWSAETTFSITSPQPNPPTGLIIT